MLFYVAHPGDFLRSLRLLILFNARLLLKSNSRIKEEYYFGTDPSVICFE